MNPQAPKHKMKFSTSELVCGFSFAELGTEQAGGQGSGAGRLGATGGAAPGQRRHPEWSAEA